MALGVIALAFGGTWLVGGYSDTECYSAAAMLPPRLQETAAIHEGADLWPPGTACVFELPNRTELVENGPVPVAEWFLLALCAALAIAVSRLWAAALSRVNSRARPE